MSMDKKSLTKEFSARLTGLREELHHSRVKMAEFFKTAQDSYRRYELGEMLPGFQSLYAAAMELGLSLDWLVCGRGPVYYQEKEEKTENETPSGLSRESGDEIAALLDHIDRIPLLRHEIMVYFYKFKVEHEDLIARSMGEKDYKL